jgi:hypothetical protein
MDICKEENKKEFLAGFAGDILAGEHRWEDHLSQIRARPVDTGILAAALAGTILFSFTFRNYPILWVASSLFIMMFYPLTFVLPALVTLTTARSETTIREYMRTLRGIGIIHHRDSFLLIVWNAFFINSQPLAIPIILLCISDLVTAVILMLFEVHPLRIILIIIAQSVVIIIFYLSIYYLKPYSHGFLERVRSMRRHFHQRGYKVFLLVAATGIFGVILSVSALLTLLFPGITVWEVMNEGKITPVKNFSELVFIFLAQYVIVRYMHGIASRKLILRINRSISEYVTTAVLPALEKGVSGQGVGDDPTDTCEDYRGIATCLIEAKMYKIHSASIFGHFPVYFIQPDLTMILDKETLNTLRGHMEIRT